MKRHLIRFQFASVLLLAVLPGAVLAQLDYAKPYVMSPMAGISSIGHADGNGTAARFYHPRGITVDNAGNIYVADTDNQLIRKITAGGEVTTLAGAPGVRDRTNGSASEARFSDPQAIVMDSRGNLLVADFNGNAIRRITPDGMVTALPWHLQNPPALTIDGSDNLYLAQKEFHTIQRITPAGQLEDYAGKVFQAGSADGPRAEAKFNDIRRLAADHNGGLFVAESYTAPFRYISPAGIVSTFPAMPGISNAYTHGLAIDTNNNLLVSATFYGTIARVTQAGQTTIIAGKQEERDYVDGSAAEARFEMPGALAQAPNGNIYVVDEGSNVIRKITPQGVVSTFAGYPEAWALGNTDGKGDAARFSDQCLVALAPDGSVVVGDVENFTIRRLAADGTVTTLAGKPGDERILDGTGEEARFTYHRAITTDALGNIYVADAKTIRKVTPSGIVSTLADLGAGYYPNGLAVNATGTVYFTDQNAVLRLKPDGAAEVYTGRFSSPSSPQYYDLTGSTDGSLSAARFNNPTGLAFDSAGNLYVADTGNNTIRRITPDGQVTTLAGAATPGSGGAIDGDRTSARFFGPSGIAVTPTGTLFVTDKSNNLIRRITPDGHVSTVLGERRARGNGAGLGVEARLDWPVSVAVTSDETLYVANQSEIYQAKPAATPIITTQPRSQTVTVGGNVQLTVIASGTPDPIHQWQFNGAAISGATSNTLTLTNVQAADAGEYTVVVSNDLGTVTSNAATLTVTATPTSPAPTPTTGGGGGGAPSAWFLAGLITLHLVRRCALSRTA
ncbi:MAG: SMP-30/gluconolactonase/LRE family protein [Cephaloticoccus sp.]|nr:SMP-30/gluconolactonase/LRE family protein [Cephaloticoccus sp.]MCF7759145.1 SMP-30/gluconolactonase/LRE family protein [Cephaloticoccus sp.]